MPPAITFFIVLNISEVFSAVAEVRIPKKKSPEHVQYRFLRISRGVAGVCRCTVVDENKFLLRCTRAFKTDIQYGTMTVYEHMHRTDP